MTACCRIDIAVFGHTACALAVRPLVDCPERYRPVPDPAPAARAWARGQVLRRIRTTVPGGTA